MQKYEKRTGKRCPMCKRGEIIEECAFTSSNASLSEIVLDGQVPGYEEIIECYCEHCGLMYKFLPASCATLPKPVDVELQEPGLKGKRKKHKVWKADRV